jgi:hypothetical protein
VIEADFKPLAVFQGIGFDVNPFNRRFLPANAIFEAIDRGLDLPEHRDRGET